MVMESKRLYTFPLSRNGLVSTRSLHLRRESTVQRSVLGNSNGEEILKISVVSQRTPQMTSNNPNFQRSWNSSRVSQGWNMLKPISTMALFFKTRTTAFPPVQSSTSPKLGLVKLSHPQSYQRVTHDIAGLRSLPTILWLRWSTH